MYLWHKLLTSVSVLEAFSLISDSYLPTCSIWKSDLKYLQIYFYYFSRILRHAQQYHTVIFWIPTKRAFVINIPLSYYTLHLFLNYIYSSCKIIQDLWLQNWGPYKKHYLNSTLHFCISMYTLRMKNNNHTLSSPRSCIIFFSQYGRPITLFILVTTWILWGCSGSPPYFSWSPGRGWNT